MSSRTDRSQYFISSEGVREDVLKHHLRTIFGERAEYRATRYGNDRGWVIEHGAKVTKERLNRLQSDSELVEKTIKEKEEVIRAQERAKARAEVSQSGKDYTARIDSQQVTQPQKPIFSRHDSLPSADTAASKPIRTSSIPIRAQKDSRQNFSTGRSTLDESSSNPYSRSPHGPFPLRDSSLRRGHTNTEPVPKPSRHDKSREADQAHGNQKEVLGNSFAKSSTRDRHRMVDPSIAARETHMQYEEADFPNIMEWQQYKKEKAEFDNLRQRGQQAQQEEVSDDIQNASVRRGNDRHKDRRRAAQTFDDPEDDDSEDYTIGQPKYGKSPPQDSRTNRHKASSIRTKAGNGGDDDDTIGQGRLPPTNSVSRRHAASEVRQRHDESSSTDEDDEVIGQSRLPPPNSSSTRHRPSNVRRNSHRSTDTDDDSHEDRSHKFSKRPITNRHKTPETQSTRGKKPTTGSGNINEFPSSRHGTSTGSVHRRDRLRTQNDVTENVVIEPNTGRKRGSKYYIETSR